MASPKIDEVQSWLVKARQDLEAAAWLLESPQSLNNQEARDALELARQVWGFILSRLPEETRIA